MHTFFYQNIIFLLFLSIKISSVFFLSLKISTFFVFTIKLLTFISFFIKILSSLCFFFLSDYRQSFMYFNQSILVLIFFSIRKSPFMFFFFNQIIGFMCFSTKISSVIYSVFLSKYHLCFLFFSIKILFSVSFSLPQYRIYAGLFFSICDGYKINIPMGNWIIFGLHELVNIWLQV